MRLEALRPLVEAWTETVRAPRRRVTVALSVLVVVGALLVARQGTVATRLGAAIGLVVFALVVWLWRLNERLVLSDPERTIRRLVGSVDPERAARALRALSLEGQTDGTSQTLAQLHVERTLRALPRDRVEDGARHLAFVLGVVALCTAAATFAVLAYEPWGPAEGADVLFARRGIAPVGMVWLDDMDVRARPPDYLHMEERRQSPYRATSLPYGTLITVRGIPTHRGRRLALTDGANEVPFVDDGSGHVVARWPLTATVELRTVARFGDVVIPEPITTAVTSIADQAPVVSLEDAPKKILLAVQADAGDIPIRYEAVDDHGLREVHLVLRSGAREERRVLARLDGETRRDRGGHVLRVTDPFIKKSHAPIEVRVEAKDNDPLTGPKWGASAAITIVPPDVGEPEAQRIEALRKLRDALVDSLAWRMGATMPRETIALRRFIAEEAKGVDENAELLDATLTSSYAGVRVTGRLQALMRGTMRKVREAMDKEAHGASQTTHSGLVKASERIVLVVDAALQGLGLADAKGAAHKLADVADDLALGASQMQRAKEKERGDARADAAVTVLEGGSKSMWRMGSLGRDLAEIIDTDLLRVARARKQEDFPHTELAAKDLAARLHQPDPSFGARGKAGHAGGESGGGRGMPGDDEGEPNDAEQAFNEAAQDIERLANEHASGMGETERALSQAGSEEDVKALAEESKKHAQAVREATKGMPSIGAGSDSWTSKGAAAREHAEQMARSLEQGNPSDAVSSGKNALQALDEAKRTAARERWMGLGHPADADHKIDDAKKKLEPEVRWAEQELDKLRKKAAERAGKELGKHGDDEEKMAQRAGQIKDKGGQGSLPQPALEALQGAERSGHEAARALKQGQVDRALELQRETQRQLEQAKEAMGKPTDQDHGEGGERDDLAQIDIPKADQHKGPEEFRKRVIKGLGQPSSGRHKDAVRRYAEGLLR